MSDGSTCVPSADDHVNDFSRAMNELQVDLAIPTSIVAAFLALNELPILKALVIVGKPMRITQIQEWARIPHLLCAYIPTEASVGATINPLVTD
jgi:hypothetical protein